MGSRAGPTQPAGGGVAHRPGSRGETRQRGPSARHAGSRRRGAGGAPPLGQGKPGGQADPGLGLVPFPRPQAAGLVWGGRLRPGVRPRPSTDPQLPGRVPLPAGQQRCGLRASVASSPAPRAGPVGKAGGRSGQCPLLPRPGRHRARQGRTRSLDQRGGCGRSPRTRSPVAPARRSGLRSAGSPGLTPRSGRSPVPSLGWRGGG